LGQKTFLRWVLYRYTVMDIHETMEYDNHFRLVGTVAGKVPAGEP